MTKKIGTDIRVLVTSGGTSERIDQVRRITNISTGRLGSLIADTFARESAGVTYLCGETTLRPSLPMEDTVTVGDVDQLAQELERLLSEQIYDCVIHSMAVSDYSVRSAITAEDLASAIAHALDRSSVAPGEERAMDVIRAAIRSYVGGENKKISSNLENMVLLMEKTPKVIGLIRALQPQTILVGFKLLVGVPEEELIRVARELMQRSGSDFVLANDLEGISVNGHRAVLIDGDGRLCRLETKQEIAEAIVDSVIREKGRREA